MRARTLRMASVVLAALSYAARAGTGLAASAPLRSPAATTPRVSGDAVPRALPPPAAVSAEATSPTSVRIAWAPDEGERAVTHYEVWRGTHSVGDPQGTSVEETGLSPEREYCYAVLAVDASGKRSPPSGPACARTPEPAEVRTLPTARLILSELQARASAPADPQGALPGAPAKPAAPPAPQLEVAFEADLSTPNGRVPLTWPSLAIDRANAEVFVIAEGFVRIFDATGMETHRFGDDGAMGQIARVAVLDDGQLVVLTTRDGKRTCIRCDFRGEPLEEFWLTGLPQALADFQPDLLVYRDGRLYFAERGTMRVVVTDVTGAFRQAIALRDIVAAGVQADLERRPAASMDAFNVDDHGNLLFTMSTMFAAGIVSPSGGLRLFGARGSRPGTFNIIGAIDADEQGNLYVTDRLRSVVSVWDRALHPVGEFGYRGDGDSNLITPYEVVVGNGRVYVAQAAKRGVKAFRVRVVAPDPAPAPPSAAPPPNPTPRAPAAPQDRRTG